MKLHLAHILKPSFRSLLFLLAAGMFLFSCEKNEDEPKRSSEASMTSLTLTVGDTDYAITFTGKEGKITVPYATELPATATVKAVALSAKAKGIKVGDSVTLPASGTVTLTVTAEDDKTTGVYTLTVEKVSASKEASITSFTFEVADNENMALDEADRQRIEGIINQQDNTITFDEQSAYVYLNRLKASFTASAGATVQVGGADQVSGVTEQDFTSSVSYVVRVQGGTETTYTVTLTKSKLATIPDAQFRAILKQFVPAAFTEDQPDITHPDVLNYNGSFSLEAQIFQLTSVKGVEFFTSLTNLSCYRNALKSLDVSKNTALVHLSCGSNSLTALDVSKNTALTNLSCYGNALKSLDVSKNTALTGLYCQSNALDSLDVSRNTALEQLYCDNNVLKSLDVSSNTALIRLECNTNSLTSLDVSVNTALTLLYCDTNKLTSLDVSANTALVTLNCSANSLPSLDVSKNTSLVTLICSTNSLPSLDVSRNTALEQLCCNDNSIQSLDVSKNTALTFLWCHNNALKSLDVSANTALTILWCHNNALTFLDMTGMRSVITLDIGEGTGTDNPLETLRVNTALQDNAAIATMKTNRGADLTVTTVNNEGTEVCADYTPAQGGGTCNDN